MTYFVKATLITVLSCAGFTNCTDCPDRWVAYQGSCYLFAHGVTKTFLEAESFCRQHNNGHLVEIQSHSENLFLKDCLRDLGGSCYWMDLSDERVEGKWFWVYSNSTPIFTEWGPANPNGGRSQNCCAFWGLEQFDYQWGDIPCSLQCGPVCKISGGACDIFG